MCLVYSELSASEPQLFPEGYKTQQTANNQYKTRSPSFITPLSLNRGILAAPWLTKCHLTLAFPLPALLALLFPCPSAPSHNVSSNLAPMPTQGLLALKGHQATSVSTEFTGKLTFLVLKSWILSVDSSVSLGRRLIFSCLNCPSIFVNFGQGTDIIQVQKLRVGLILISLLSSPTSRQAATINPGDSVFKQACSSLLVATTDPKKKKSPPKGVCKL